MAGRDVAIMAGGCFWCIEPLFASLNGVVKVESGYIGGTVERPTYQQVCSGRTGHAEAIRVTFDPAVISYSELLDIFFAVHDPTTLNRQGNDVGTQYRSAVFVAGDGERAEAEAAIERAQANWPDRIVTEVTPASTFYIAEDYHQDYYANNPSQPYCAAVINPKVAKFRKEFAARLTDKAR